MGIAEELQAVHSESHEDFEGEDHQEDVLQVEPEEEVGVVGLQADEDGVEADDAHDEGLEDVGVLRPREVRDYEDAHDLQDPHQPGEPQYPQVVHEGRAVVLALHADQGHDPHVQHAREHDDQVDPVPADGGGLAEEQAALVQQALQRQLHDVEDQEGVVQQEEVLRVLWARQLYDHDDDVDDDDREAEDGEAVAVHEEQAPRARRGRPLLHGVLQVLQGVLPGLDLRLRVLQVRLCCLQAHAEHLHVLLLRLHLVLALRYVPPEALHPLDA
mmetsp:Transcript_118621/g.382990  ORF Transcript_118621/g.382990 Transcript_118621/m.382990 type:complete len:272 (-) Transcript_118621:111-926(-)